MLLPWLTLLGCGTSTDRVPDAERTRSHCYTLKHEVPAVCDAMARTALAENDLESAWYGFSVACDSQVDEACRMAPVLMERGVEPVMARAIVMGSCFDRSNVVACDIYLELVDGHPEGTTPELVERARRIVAGHEDPPSAADSDAAQPVVPEPNRAP